MVGLVSGSEEIDDEQLDEIWRALAVIAEELGLSSSEPYDIEETDDA